MNREAGQDASRSRADEALDAERHQEIARCLFRESNDALFLFDPEDHRVLDLNPAAMRLTGFTKDDARAKKLWDLFRGESPAQLAPVMEAYRRTGFYHSREGFSLSRKVGVPIPVNVSVSRIHTRPTPLGLVIARDVTERKRDEAALRESEARYRGLIETAKVVFWTLGPDGRILHLNPQFSAVTGWTCDAWTGRPLLDLIATADREAARAWIAHPPQGELPSPIELGIANRTGGTTILEFLPTAAADVAGGRSLSGIARDITESRRMAEAVRKAEALERARRAAEAADRAKSEFLAHFSHEIRTPLTAILGFTDVLLADDHVAGLPPERREDLRLIERNGAHLLAIINDILDLSEVESGKLRIRPEPCSPREIGAEVLAALSGRAEEAGLDLTLDADAGGAGSLVTDPVRVRQVLINLVGNALKFTKSGGVKVRVRRHTALEVAVEVIDSGPGIPRETLARVFEPFYRAEPGTEGSGLGLAISRRLAEALGGRIEVESEPGRGSTFRLILPDLPSDQPSAPARRPESSPAPLPVEPLDARVLLAEDNPSIQRVTALHLEKAGASVTLARNGQEAVDAVSEAAASGLPFDVVLMDMQMPVLDGYEATRQLRADGFSGTIVALTAYAMPEDRDECLRIGCDEHLAKPIDWSRLISLIAEHLRSPAGR